MLLETLLLLRSDLIAALVHGRPNRHGELAHRRHQVPRISGCRCCAVESTVQIGQNGTLQETLLRSGSSTWGAGFGFALLLLLLLRALVLR
jgi:hypothetical protein